MEILQGGFLQWEAFTGRGDLTPLLEDWGTVGRRKRGSRALLSISGCGPSSPGEGRGRGRGSLSSWVVTGVKMEETVPSR